MQAKWRIGAGAYPSFCSMKQLRIYLLPPGYNASPSQGYPQHYIYRHPFVHLAGERHCESKVSCTRTQHNVQGLNLDHSIRSKTHLPWDHRTSTGWRYTTLQFGGHLSITFFYHLLKTKRTNSKSTSNPYSPSLSKLKYFNLPFFSFIQFLQNHQKNLRILQNLSPLNILTEGF